METSSLSSVIASGADTVRVCVFFLALIGAAYMDLKHRIISDRITIWGTVAGILLFTLSHGTSGLTASGTGWALGFFPFYLLFRLGGLGLGDVKLMGMVGALGGPMLVLYGFWYTGIIGFVLALVVLIHKGQLQSGMKRVWLLCLKITGLGKKQEAQELAETLTIPYGLAIVFGSYLAFFRLVG